VILKDRLQQRVNYLRIKMLLVITYNTLGEYGVAEGGGRSSHAVTRYASLAFTWKSQCLQISRSWAIVIVQHKHLLILFFLLRLTKHSFQNNGHMTGTRSIIKQLLISVSCEWLQNNTSMRYLITPKSPHTKTIR